MTTNKYIFPLICLLLSLTARAGCPETDPRRVSVIHQRSKAAINEIYKQQQLQSSSEASRNTAILAVYLVSEGRLDNPSIERLSRQAANHPDDHFAKLYEGYAWIFSAEKHNKEKNYLRAAEYLKRGFFLIDESVDSDPKNWRLRFLRMRLDAFVPSDLGRYVVALKDASILTAAISDIPQSIHPFIYALKSSAIERSGNPDLSARNFFSIAENFKGTEIESLSNLCDLKNLVSAEEINELLVYALSHKK